LASGEQRGPAVLVIGAGAVGQVFGDHLSRAGASITLFVREKYREDVARGFDMYRLTTLGGGTRRIEVDRFDAFDVVSSTSEIAARRFDQVYVTLPSDAVRSGTCACTSPRSARRRASSCPR
jgi:2-dehydropantoate 2-reductase